MSATHEMPVPEGKRMEKFLPWYVAGRLNATERAQVDDYLRRNPGFAHSLKRVQAEHDELVSLYESLGTPRGGALNRLMATIEADTAPRPAPAKPSAMQRLSAWFKDLTPRQLAFAAVATFTVFAAQAAAIAVLSSKYATQRSPTVATAPDQRQQPRLATAPAQPPAAAVATNERAAIVTGGTFLLIAFQESARQGEMNDLLKRFGATIVEGPTDGKYKLRLLDMNAAKGVAAESAPRSLPEVAAQLRAQSSLVRQVEVLK